ncbi:GIY-YIG nuclease family protein [Sphingomonas parva]|uniref:GIY-YIG nuclease family protein n=1 Tax=Sphingomonas parva TaxID=2555898 RepID=A0A4Y8ZT72_9SPHN|nr:GIY-YIG nuclease family protein [Sphingomonas parva]TFI58697.1 GIY-YIG nuclease family protein [Sphingomonas parva]
MKSEDRKAATAAWKERKASAGIYAVRCEPSGEAWVGRAPDLAAVENRIGFALRMASTPHRSLRDAARVHGADAFRFEVLERLDEEEATGLGRDRILKARHAHWVEALAATAI